MYPTLAVSFSKPLRKDASFFDDPPEGMVVPVLQADGYHSRDTYVIHESMPSFGISFGVIQVSNAKTLRGTWRISDPCVVVAYSEAGNIQLAIRGYGDAIAPRDGKQSAAPVPRRPHFFFVNAGVHRLYYFTISYGMLGLLCEDMPELGRLRDVPHHEFAPWQDYAVSEADFRLLQSILETDTTGLKKHQFLQHQFHKLMARYYERIARFGDNPNEQTETIFYKALQYVREHFRNPDLTVPVIADAMNLSLDGMKKAFVKNDFKATHFINILRVHEGMDLLRTTDLPVSDIAFRAGFHNRSHFSELFRKKFGVSPSEYRNKLKINNKRKMDSPNRSKAG